MATWKPENSILTQVGTEILNKVKAGIGSITVTKVLAGSGRVDTSALYSQKSISGVQKSMIIAKRKAYTNGSEITVNITNVGFTEEFHLHQIGIFVTHPDYAGEQLYHISQCEGEGYDSIPAPTDGSATLEYSLYLEHSNSSTTTIVVNPEGFLSSQEFEDFKKNLTIGELVYVDSEGNLKSSGKTISELSGKNLLNNWYFLNPIDTKKGLFVSKGVTYYSNTGLTASAGTTSADTPATYVNGTYSTILVNGTTYYVRTSYTHSGYAIQGGGITLDRWSMYSPNAYSSLLYDSTGTSLVLKPKATLSQYVNKKVHSSRFMGLTFTLSVNVLNYQSDSLYFGVDFGSSKVTQPFTKYGINTVTFEVPDELDDLEIVIGNSHSSSEYTIELASIKLEAGKVSTLAIDPPPDYAEQAAICIQYDPQTDNYVGFATATTALAEASIE